MQKIEILVGIPSSGKSSYCRELIQKEPGQWKRINNDSLREAIDFGIFSKENEQTIANLRDHMLRDFLKRGFNVLVDNLNIGKLHWEKIHAIAKGMNLDIEMSERLFYIDLEEAIARDAKRGGSACVGEKVIKYWYGKTGKEKFKDYQVKNEIFKKRDYCLDALFTPALQNENADKAIICDLDGSLALVGNRSPYDASQCDLVDKLNVPVAETVKLFYNKGYKILFCSGREDKHREPTIRFIEKHLPGMEYKLFMRPTGNFQKDAVIKEEIYNQEIKDKYNILMVLDDRSSVITMWREKLGLTCFQVAEGNF